MDLITFKKMLQLLEILYGNIPATKSAIYFAKLKFITIKKFELIVNKIIDDWQYNFFPPIAIFIKKNQQIEDLEISEKIVNFKHFLVDRKSDLTNNIKSDDNYLLKTFYFFGSQKNIAYIDIDRWSYLLPKMVIRYKYYKSISCGLDILPGVTSLYRDCATIYYDTSQSTRQITKK